MEPINYRDALRRRWPVVVALALVGAVIGGLFPESSGPAPHAQYEASVLIGVAPGSSKGAAGIGGQVSLQQITFFAANQQVIANAAKAAGVKGKASILEKDIVISAKKKKKSLTPPGTMRISLKQPSARRSAKLTNDFVTALTDFINQQLKAQHDKNVRIAEQKISNLTNTLSNLESELQSQEPTPSTTTTTTTTTTTIPGTTTTTTHGAVTAATANALARQVASTADEDSPARATLTASKNNPDIAQLQEQINVDTQAYQAALSALNSLNQNPIPRSGIVVLQPALAKDAKKIPAHVSILHHHSILALLGLVAGAVLGVVLCFLLDALDKRLRTVTRTQETLGYPVLAEIPEMSNPAGRWRRWLRGTRTPPEPASPFAVFSDPGSVAAEAYRMLRTAMLLEPIMGPDPSLEATGEHRPREVILVVSAGAEPSRALVVTNLAAAFAEADQQAIVVTTADLRRREPAQETMVMASMASDMSPADVAEATRPTEVPGVRSLALGRILEGPGQLAPYAPGILASARQVADVVIVDAALLAVHDAEALVPAVDMVLVVVQGWWTRVDQATRSGVFLRRIAAPVVGAVLTEVHFGRKDLRRIAERPYQRRDAEEEDQMVGASSMVGPGRKRGRRSRWAEA